jgi:Cu/Zn superoxide dismutase
MNKKNLQRRELLVHIRADDLGLGGAQGSQKTGNAGARVVFGTIYLQDK